MIVDASVWVSMMSSTEINHQRSRMWFRHRLSSSDDVMIPSLALAEVSGAVARRRRISIQSARRVTNWMVQLPNLSILPLHQRLAYEAADVAATYRLRGADAIYVAVAIEQRVPLVTWDRELQQRAASVIEVIQP